MSVTMTLLVALIWVAVVGLATALVPGPGNRLAIGGWIGSLVVSDAVCWYSWLTHPHDLFWASWQIAVPGLVTVLITLVSVIRYSRRWVRLIADSWLLGGCFALVLWVASVAALPQLDLAATRSPIIQIGCSLWLTMVLAMAYPAIGSAERRTVSKSVLIFLTLRSEGLIAFFIGVSTRSDPVLWVGLGLVAASYLWLLATPRRSVHLAVADRSVQPVQVPQLVPAISVLVAAVVTAVLLLISDAVSNSTTYVLFGLVVVMLAISQMLSAASNRRLLDTITQREEHFRMLVRDSTDVMGLCSPDGIIEYLSPRAQPVMDIDPDAMVGKHLAEVLRLPQDAVSRLLEETLRDDATTVLQSSFESAGGLAHLETVVSAQDGRFICTIRDVTERIELQRQLHDLAYTDQLTGLPNRAALTELISDSISGPAACAVMFLDLDGFKRVNDGGGHAVGDEVLAEVGRRLNGELRPGTTAGRLGGDEFLIVVPDTDRFDVEDLAQRVTQAVRRPYPTQSGLFVIGVSIGIARRSGGLPSPAHAEQAVADLVRNADLAAYEAKRNKEGWRWFHPLMLTSAVARAEQDAELESALSADRTFLLFQPVVDLRTRRMVSAEALLRWRAPDGSVRGPAGMLEYAARTGQTSRLLLAVLNRALAACATWPTPVGVGVNLSPQQLDQPGLAASVRAALLRHRVAPDRLTLEITEVDLMANPPGAANVLRELHGLGARIAADDFGTAFSSLSHLMDLPLDQVKLDRSLVSRIDTNPQAAALVDGIQRMAVGLGLGVVAEGIERPSQRERLLDLGCSHGQGYLFAPPLAAEEVQALAQQSQLPEPAMATAPGHWPPLQLAARSTSRTPLRVRRSVGRHFDPWSAD